MIPDHIKHAMGEAQVMQVDGEDAHIDSIHSDGSVWVDGELGIVVIVAVTNVIANRIEAIDSRGNVRRIELYNRTPYIIPLGIPNSP